MSLSGSIQGNGITATIQTEMAAGSAGPTLTANGWPAGFTAIGYSNETWPKLRIDGATSPQSLAISVTLPSPNDSVDIYTIAIDDGTTTTGTWYSIGDFNSATGQAASNPMYMHLLADYNGTEILPRTITFTVSHVQANAVVGTFTFTFNPEPV